MRYCAARARASKHPAAAARGAAQRHAAARQPPPPHTLPEAPRQQALLGFDQKRLAQPPKQERPWTRRCASRAAPLPELQK
jgi:hypothetical protein